MAKFYKKTSKGNVSVGRWRVVDPRVIKRVGYPFDVKARASELFDNERYLDGDHYRLLSGEHRGPMAIMLEGQLGKAPTYRAVQKLCHAMAYAEGEVCGWGGDVREVFLDEPMPYLVGATVPEGCPAKVHRLGRRVFEGYEEGFSFYPSETVVAVKVWGKFWIPFSHLERVEGGGQ